MRLGVMGESILKNLEGLRFRAYKDSGGVWTIGYGTIRIAGIPVCEGMEINELVASALLIGETTKVVQEVKKVLLAPLNQNQIDALIIFTYNVGTSGFQHSSLLRAVNNKKPITELLFTMWNKIRNKKTGILEESEGLTNRRMREFALFNLPITKDL